jgi:hypothetical protein
MINEAVLRDALVSLAEQAKAQHVGLCAVAQEVAALRETVRGLDPTFSELFEKQRQAQSIAEVESVAVGLLDEIIRRLRNGEVC